MSRLYSYAAVFFLLLLSHSARSQSCEYYLPYNQNFNQGFDLQVGYFNPTYDTTLVYYENCWTQYLYRSSGRWSFVGRLPHANSNYALRLYASHPIDGDNRVEYTYMLSPAFREDPTTIMFDYCNHIASTEKDDEGQWIDITLERTGILQLGYISDTLQPESSYHAITNLVLNPADGATDVLHHFRLDLRSMYNPVPHVKKFAFKILTEMTGVKYTNIYIDNFHASREMDTVDYRDTVCPGEPYDGYGFTIDSTETVDYGLHTFTREVMESEGMVFYRLSLWVEEPVTTYIDTTLAYGDTLWFLDSLIVNTGNYVFLLSSAHGCDSTVVLSVRAEEVGLLSSAQKICSGEEIILTASGTVFFRWASVPADPVLASLQGRNPIAVHPQVNTVYQLLDTGGTVLAAVEIESEPCEGLWFPNVFTPDAESNNRFTIQTTYPVESFEMTIYTRNGLLVWHTEDINQMWDGTRNGTSMPQGAYVYHWRLKSNNRVRSGLGTMTLLR